MEWGGEGGGVALIESEGYEIKRGGVKKGTFLS